MCSGRCFLTDQGTNQGLIIRNIHIKESKMYEKNDATRKRLAERSKKVHLQEKEEKTANKHSPSVMGQI